jgi:hypothetical protein
MLGGLPPTFLKLPASAQRIDALLANQRTKIPNMEGIVALDAAAAKRRLR